MGKELYQVILEQTAAGKIEKNTGIELLRQLKADKSREDDRIAIIGMSGKFPSCQTLEDFWDIIEQGVNVHRPATELRPWDIQGLGLGS